MPVPPTHIPANCRTAITRPAFRALAGVLALAVLAIGLGAASPEVHEHVHCDAHEPAHVCAITLATIGFCDTAAEPPAVEDTRAPLRIAVAAVESHRWMRPAHWLNPALAPPAR